jgi:hypothetical protein
MSEEFPQGAGPLPPVTTEDVVSLARAAISSSREESRRADDVSSSGITVDLTHKNIARLPDEVIDIIKDEIERSVVAISLSFRSRRGPFYDETIHFLRLSIAHLPISTWTSSY